MSDYAAGFSDGERDAYRDRQNAIRRTQSDAPRGEYQRGYLDGYRPRNPAWALTQTAQPWWAERESTAA